MVQTHLSKTKQTLKQSLGMLECMCMLRVCVGGEGGGQKQATELNRGKCIQSTCATDNINAQYLLKDIIATCLENPFFGGGGCWDFVKSVR